MVVRCFFFFQAEDGIRDATVTGVQTCALPISLFSVNTERISLRRKKSVKQSGPNLEINSQLPPPPSSPPSPQQQQQQQQHKWQHSPPQLQLQTPIPLETKQDEFPHERRPSNNGLQYLFTPTGNS